MEGVRLYHDQALNKDPGGGYTPWHCDGYYWPVQSDKIVTAWVPLQVPPPPSDCSHMHLVMKCSSGLTSCSSSLSLVDMPPKGVMSALCLLVPLETLSIKTHCV